MCAYSYTPTTGFDMSGGYNPWDEYFNVDPITGKKKVNEGMYSAPKNTFADYFTTAGDASTFNYGKAGYKDVTNPWAAIQQQGYKQTTNPYSQDYINTLMGSIRNQANQQVSSPEFAQQSEDLRGQLANKGVLRGTGYDVTQGNRVMDIFRQSENQAQNTGAEARLKGMEFGANQEQSANDYMRNIAQQLGLFGANQEQAKNSFMQDYMSKYMGQNQATETGKSGWMNDIMSSRAGAVNPDKEISDMESIIKAGQAPDQIKTRYNDYMNQRYGTSGQDYASKFESKAQGATKITSGDFAAPSSGFAEDAYEGRHSGLGVDNYVKKDAYDTVANNMMKIMKARGINKLSIDELKTIVKDNWKNDVNPGYLLTIWNDYVVPEIKKKYEGGA